MAAPTPASTPHAPAGIRIENGHPTVITLAADSDISFWEVDVTPPGIDGGDANDLTNMHNDNWRTFAARTLKTLTEAQTTVQVAPGIFTQITAICNVETTVTIHMPGGDKLAFYGYLRTWAPAAWVEGEPPSGTITIQPTNRDPSNDTEEGPVFVAASTGVNTRQALRKSNNRVKRKNPPKAATGKKKQQEEEELVEA